MKQIAVIYWSSTGNTEAMAKAIAEGAGVEETEVKVFEVSEISAGDAAAYEKLALGCSAMGDEVLDEGEFEPFFTELESSLNAKKVALFGSYGWGDGAWMRDWEERVKNAGGQLFREEGLILCETPDEEGIVSCKAFGKAFAAF